MQRKHDDLEARQHEGNGYDMFRTFRTQPRGCARAQLPLIATGRSLLLDTAGIVSRSPVPNILEKSLGFAPHQKLSRAVLFAVYLAERSLHTDDELLADLALCLRPHRRHYRLLLPAILALRPRQ